jgi:hypothetical protein
MLAENYPVRVVCRTLGYPVSSYYYRSEAANESELKIALQRLAGEWPTYGRPDSLPCSDVKDGASITNEWHA